MAARIVLTYADYAAIPSDGKRYELHEGDLSVTPVPGIRHQRVVLNLVLVLTQHVAARQLGEVFVSPVDCILSDTIVVQPDIVYAKHRVPYYWIVDAGQRTVQAFELSGDAYRQVGSLEGGRSVALPPFTDLPLGPAAIWP